ncbi:hypothetical protein HU200_064308 [Digitaria exilis]|uniref:Uncharacterized protein n=1 Tax=Digitaria exilis TaxID=1010633 RepID=A0A835A1R5_9POAL|nr:hypothetical protein HU200_064308 [Digitaria exilis]
MVSALASGMTAGCRGEAQKRSRRNYTSLHGGNMRRLPPA